MSEDSTYSPRVASSDSTIFRKIAFVNTSDSESGRLLFFCTSAATFSMPFTASSSAATFGGTTLSALRTKRSDQRHTVIYTVINANPTMAIVYPHLEPCGLFPSERMKHMMIRPR